MDGMMSFSVGRYLDRDFTADLALRYDRKTSSLLHVEYHGSNGHEPFAGSSANSGFDRLKAGLKSSIRTGPVILSSNVAGFKNAYSVFGLTPNTGAQSQSHPDRDFSGADLSLGVSTLPGTRMSANLEFSGGFSSVSTDVFDASIRVDPATSRDETFLTSRASISLPITDGYIAVSASGTTSGLDGASFPGSTVQSGYTQALVSYLYSKKLNVKGGVAVMGFRSDPQTAADRNRSLSYLSPIAELSYTYSQSLRFYGGNQPSLDSGLMRNTYAQAPFIQDQPLLLPSITSLDANTGVEYLSQYVTAKAQVGYKDQPNRRYALRSASSSFGYSTGFSALAYDDATVFYGKLDIGVVLWPGMQIGVNAELRQAELSDSGAEIPYYSPLAIGGFGSASFLDGDALIQVDFRHEAARTIDLVGGLETGSISLVSIEGSYFLAPNYGISLGVRNLGSSPEFWQLYPMESSTVYFGAKYRW